MATYDVTTNGGTPITKWGYVEPHRAVVRNITDSLEERISELERISEMLKHLAPPEYTELRCRECGGEIDQKWDDHIVKCPYCKTVYVIGRKMLNG